MSDEDALLTAIAAHPEEDTPRLIYADWLDEHADVLADPTAARMRAEFIRVQCAVAQLEGVSQAEHGRSAAVVVRDRALTAGWRDELLGSLAGLERCADIWFWRGFVAQVRLTVDAFLAHADLLARARPLPGVRVTRVAARSGDFLRCPHLDIVTEISAFAAPMGEFEGVPDDLSELTDHLSRLEVLDLEGCHIPDRFCDLLPHVGLPALRVLNLSRNALTDRGVADLLVTHHPQKLRRLLLGGNAITDVGAIRLAEGWPRRAADNLEYLGLRDTQIGLAGEIALRARFGGRVEL
jgi:uncharacterized protein (TIGR02996 family)